MDAVIPNAMMTLVSSCAGSIPDAAASACLEAVARWRGAEGATRGRESRHPRGISWRPTCPTCASTSARNRQDGWVIHVDVTRVITARLSSLAGVARGLAAVAADAKSPEEIAAAVSGSIVNLEKVLTGTPKVTDPNVTDSASTMDARAAGWTAAAALLSVPLVRRESLRLSASASAATVRLLDDALEGLPAVSSAGDEPSRLLAALRAIAALLERVVPAFPGEPELSLGVKIASSVERAVRSSRLRKNAPIWAAAESCVLHPRLFGASSRLHARASDGSAGSSSTSGAGSSSSGAASVDGIGACAWFVRKAIAAGSKTGERGS